MQDEKMTQEQSMAEWRNEYTKYLSTLSIGVLRSLGRHVGVSQATVKKKAALTGEIVDILTGVTPPAPKTNRGAPVKDVYVDPKIYEKLEEIKLVHLSNQDPNAVPPPAEEEDDESGSIYPKNRQKNVIEVNSNDHVDRPMPNTEEVYTGQLETINGVSALLSLDGRRNEKDKIIVNISLIQQSGLRDGDIVSCHAQKNYSALIAEEILSVNGLCASKIQRVKFEQCEVAYPSQRISLYAEENSSNAMKYIDWLAPFGKGQRGLIIAPPKTGKTTLLKEVAYTITKNHPEIRLLVLLTDQSPESVTEFKKIVDKDSLVYTTYDDDAEAQVFTADFIMKRAKSFAELGMDVLLLVDSFTNLAHAYNEVSQNSSDKLLTSGWENNTIHYMKKYFGAARRFENEGSLSLLGSVSTQTNNPMDDVLAGELFGISNSALHLSDELAAKKIYPAISVYDSKTQKDELLLPEKDRACADFIRGTFLPTFGEVALAVLIEKCENSAQLYEKAKAVYNANAAKSKK